ncbi:MAG: lipopolysaccharide heptosyltransferase II [Deltaproteobacteria bacterium]|nr:lipopolysaccharide heptosyltransferase II [Deltaproteobacteria bacterium]
MKILIVKLSAIGDVVLSLPFLAALRHAYPQASISWVVEEAASDLLCGHPDLDRVIIWRRKSWVRAIKQGRIRSAVKDFLTSLQAIRREHYDLVIDLQGLFKSGLIVYLSGGRRRLGFNRTRELSYLFINDRMPPYDIDRHALLRYLDVAGYLGAFREKPEFHLPLNSSAAQVAGQLLSPSARLMVILNPGAKWPSKLWPLESWQELARLLTAQSNLQVVLTGAGDEVVFNQKIAADLHGVIDLTGRTGLRVLAEIFRRAAVVICPDTGPMHLAAAVGTPVVALFGPTAPWRTGPFGPHHVIVKTNIACSPCFWKKCPEAECMSLIKPGDVLLAIDDVLKNRAL